MYIEIHGLNYTIEIVSMFIYIYMIELVQMYTPFFTNIYKKRINTLETIIYIYIYIL